MRSSDGKIPVVAPSSAIMLQIVARWVTFSVATPSPKNSNTLPRPPRTPRRRKSSRIDVLGLDPRRRPAAELDAHDSWRLDLEGRARQRGGDLEPAGADRDHAERARCRRVAVGTDEQLPRASEALDVQIVADAVSGRESSGCRVERRTSAGSDGHRGS